METPAQTVQAILRKMHEAVILGQPKTFQRFSDQLSIITMAHMELPFDGFPDLPLGVLMRRMANCLILRIGKTVPRGQLLNAMYFDRPNEPHHKIVDVQICKLRELLINSGYHIENIWGQGYKMVRDGTA